MWLVRTSDILFWPGSLSGFVVCLDFSFFGIVVIATRFPHSASSNLQLHSVSNGLVGKYSWSGDRRAIQTQIYLISEFLIAE